MFALLLCIETFPFNFLGPSASAYVTYHRPEDALKAIHAVNNVYVDGRTLKASLGTTKYCSHFLRGSQCPKPVSFLSLYSYFPLSMSEDDALLGVFSETYSRIFFKYLRES